MNQLKPSHEVYDCSSFTESKFNAKMLTLGNQQLRRCVFSKVTECWKN